MSMFSGEMLGKGSLGTEGLGKKDSGNFLIARAFQTMIGGCLILHAAAPAVYMGRVREKLEDGKITRRNSPEAGGRSAGGQALVDRIRVCDLNAFRNALHFVEQRQ